MCGIVGFTGRREASPILLEGLRRLEYRGYDSAGLVTGTGADLHLRKKAGRIAELGKAVAPTRPPGTYGISHTRWATHGGATDRNAHPHLDATGDHRRRPQRRHRELRRAQAAAPGRRRRSSARTPTPKCSRT